MSGRLGGPVRTCIGCRERAERNALVRMVVQEDSSGQFAWILVPDVDHVMPGRGAHVHPDVRCLDQAKRRRAFGRALRVEGKLDLSLIDELAKTWPPPPSAGTTDRKRSQRS